MTRERKVIYRSKPRTVVDVFETDYVAPEVWSKFGEFIAVRRRPHDNSPFGRRLSGDEKEAKNRRTFDKCVGCRRKFSDDDNIHFAQSVFKNGKCLGNLFACDDCAARFNEIKQEA